MNLETAKTLGKAFKCGMAFSKGRSFKNKALAHDASRWITVKPNGAENKGRPALIDESTGEVLGGMGGKFNGRHITATRNQGKNEAHGAQAVIDRSHYLKNNQKSSAELRKERREKKLEQAKKTVENLQQEFDNKVNNLFGQAGERQGQPFQSNAQGQLDYRRMQKLEESTSNAFERLKKAKEQVEKLSSTYNDNRIRTSDFDAETRLQSKISNLESSLKEKKEFNKNLSKDFLKAVKAKNGKQLTEAELINLVKKSNGSETMKQEIFENIEYAKSGTFGKTLFKQSPEEIELKNGGSSFSYGDISGTSLPKSIVGKTTSELTTEEKNAYKQHLYEEALNFQKRLTQAQTYKLSDEISKARKQLKKVISRKRSN